MLRKFLFPTAVSSNVMSLGLLLLRLTFGLSMAIFHGYGKLVNYGSRVDSFNDNFFPGALILVILAEFFCAISFAAGFLTRLAVIPLIINMLVAFFSHSGFNEIAFVYLMVFIVFFITGSGKYSVDSLLSKA